MRADGSFWRNVRLVDVREGGKAGSVSRHPSLCCQLVHLLWESRRDDGVLRRDHRVGHDAQPYRVAVVHQCEGQTCRQSIVTRTALAVRLVISHFCQEHENSVTTCRHVT